MVVKTDIVVSWVDTMKCDRGQTTQFHNTEDRIELTVFITIRYLFDLISVLHN
jgi:hypothetical protein